MNYPAPRRVWLTAALCAPFLPSTVSIRAQPAAPAPREVFPHVRVDVQARVVEFDARVPTVMDDAAMAPAFLEVVACIPDTKEHETLVVTPARPSHVHAALLMIGLTPGEPGAWEWDGQRMVPRQPAGDRVRVEFVYTAATGEQRVEPAYSWIKHDRTGGRLAPRNWIFAGSRMLDRGFGQMYDADGTGTLIGLSTFGSETLAWPIPMSPDSAIEEPVWVADPARVPPLDTPVVVRLTPAP